MPLLQLLTRALTDATSARPPLTDMLEVKLFILCMNMNVNMNTYVYMYVLYM